MTDQPAHPHGATGNPFQAGGEPRTPESPELTPPLEERRSDRADVHSVWAVAAQLASGMLANSAKSSFTVKDSISLFDEILHEITAYAAMRGEFGATASNDHADRRQQRAEAFLGHDQRAAAPRMRPVPPPMAPAPEAPDLRQPAPPSSGDGTWGAPAAGTPRGAMPELPNLPPMDGYGREAG